MGTSVWGTWTVSVWNELLDFMLLWICIHIAYWYVQKTLHATHAHFYCTHGIHIHMHVHSLWHKRGKYDCQQQLANLSRSTAKVTLKRRRCGVLDGTCTTQGTTVLLYGFWRRREHEGQDWAQWRLQLAASWTWIRHSSEASDWVEGTGCTLTLSECHLSPCMVSST